MLDSVSTGWPSGAPPAPGRYRARRLLALAAIAVAAAFAVPRFLTHTPYARLGAGIDWKSPDGAVRIRTLHGPPAVGLLERGDVLRMIDGQPATLDRFRKLRLTGGLPRGPLAIVVERRGHLLRLTLPPVQLSGWQRIRLYLVPLAGVVAAPLVAFLLVWRRPDLSTAWVFLWFTAIQAIAVVWGLFRFPQTDPGGLLKVWLTIYDGLTWWLPASFLHFMTVFPRPRWTRVTQWKSPWFWLVVLAYASPPLLWLQAGGMSETRAGMQMLVFQTVAMLAGTLSLVDRYARKGPDGRRPGLGERTLAFAVAVTLLLVTISEFAWESPQALVWLSIPLVNWAFTSIQLAWLFSPLVIAFLVANDPAFDPRRLFVQSLPYALLTFVLVAIYITVVVVGQRLFAAATGESAIVFNVVAAVVVAFAFEPLRARLQGGLDRLFGRDPEALRVAFDQAGRDLLGALDEDEVRRAVEDGLARGLKRRVALEWPAQGPPRLAPDAAVPDHAHAALDNLLVQAGIRLENLALQAQRAAVERESAELRESATRAELRALHAQVQPHFLFNALNALSFLIETEPPAAQRFTERLADMLRYTVEAGSRPAALLSEEIGFVEDYLGVARERYENPLEFRFEGPQELLSTPVPPLLLQPLVENSLKHGCTADGAPLHMAVAAARDNGHVRITFSDDGSPNGGGTRGLGVGLMNLEQRLRRFAGPGANMVAGAGRGGGFQVALTWPVAPAEGTHG
jgi:histidine kinase